MSKTAWILILSIGLPVTAAIIVARWIAHAFVNRITSTKTIGAPPDEYLQVLKRPDSGDLQFRKTTLFKYRTPVSQFRYSYQYEILETKFEISDTTRFGDKVQIIQSFIQTGSFTDFYDVLELGRIDVNFEGLDRPDTGFGKIYCRIDGHGFESAPRNDSVISYYLEKGYFSISRSPRGTAAIYSSEKSDDAGFGSSAPTELLFKRRGHTVYFLVASPVNKKMDIPSDFLLRLAGDRQ